ncbi:hypothetical protein EON64_00445 [archaeon]|nr:MAG: hypothetical protein EON64_00445 [archaeon]
MDISVSHGLMSLSRSGLNFTRGQGKWRTEYFDERMEITRNNHSILQFIASDRLDLYNLKCNGIGYFPDIVLDKTLLQPIIVAYCKAERKALGRSKRDIDACSSDTSKLHLSNAQLFEQVGKILLSITEASHTSAEEVHNRLKGSYEDAVKTVVEEFNNELSTVKESHTEFLAWQEKQREALNSMSNVEEVVQNFKEQLTSNLIFVEERQEDLFTQVNELRVFTALNLSDVEVRLSELVNNTLPLLVDATKNLTAELVDSKLDPVVADTIRVESIVNGSLASISTLNARQHSMQRETNSSLGLLESAIVILNSTIMENYIDIIDSITTINQSLSFLGRTMEEDVESKLTNLTMLINHTTSDLLSLAAQQNKSHTLVSDSITALNNLVHSNIEELRNFTFEGLDWAMNLTAANHTHVLRVIDSVNASLQIRADTLMNTTQDLYRMVELSSGRNQEQLSEAVNNISMSIAHSNSIFAKVVKELNSTLAVLNDNHVALQTVLLPGKIEEVANKSSVDLQSAVSELTSFFTDGLELVQWEAAKNLTNLHSNVTADIRIGLEGVNNALLTIVEMQKQDRVEVQSMLAEYGSNHTAALKATKEQISYNISSLNFTTHALISEAINRHNDLNASLIQAISQVIETAHNNTDSLHNLMTNRTEMAYQQIASLDSAVLKIHHNLTKELSEFERISYENITIVHEILTQELGSEVARLLSLLNDSSEATAELNMRLSTAIRVTADKLQQDITGLETSVNASQQALRTDMLNSENHLIKLLDSLDESSSAQLARNVSSIRTDMNQAFEAAEASIRALDSQTAANFTSLHHQLTGELDTTKMSMQAVLNTSKEVLGRQISGLEDNLQTLYSATYQNFTEMLEHVVFESDYIQGMVNESRRESAEALKTVSDRLQLVNNSLSHWTDQFKLDVQGVQEIVHTNVTHVLHVIQDVNGSLVQYGEKSNAAFANFTAIHRHDFSHLLSKLAEMNATHEHKVDTHIATLNQQDVILGSLINTTRLDLQYALNNLSANIEDARNFTDSSIASLSSTLTLRFDQLIANSYSKHDANTVQLRSKVDAQNSELNTTLTELIRTLNDTVAKNAFAHAEILALHSKSEEDNNRQVNRLQDSISIVESSIMQLSELEASERNELGQNMSDTVNTFKREVEQTLYEAEVKTNMSLLQHQVVVSGQAEKLNSLQSRLDELKVAHGSVSSLVTNQSSTLALFQSLHSQHIDHALDMNSQMRSLTSGVIPGLTTNISILHTWLQGLQKDQESSQTLQAEIQASQLQQSANITLLTARLADEVSARREQDSHMHAFFSTELNRTAAHTSQVLSTVQETVNSHAEKIAMVIGQTSVLGTASEKYSQDIYALKSKAAMCEATTLEVDKLSKQVDSLQTHIREREGTYQNEIQELRASLSQALELIKTLQGSVDKQGDKLEKVAQESILLQASAASREQVDQLRDKVVEVQQGVVLQTTSALQLVQTFYQQQQVAK